LTVIIQTDNASEITVVEILAQGGQSAEPAGKEGLAYLAARLALEIPDFETAGELMEKSSRFSVSVQGDGAIFRMASLSEYLDSSLKVFAHILKEPIFSGVRIDRNKNFMTQQRAIESDDNLNLGHLSHRAALLGDFGLASSAYGSRESLASLKGREIETFYREHFGADKMVLAVVSNLDSAESYALVEKYFRDFPRVKSPSGPEAAVRSQTPSLASETFIAKETRQSLVSVGYLLPKISARNYALARLVESLLGKGPGSRLWELRSSRKLAYNVGARATLMKEAGLLEAYLETEAAKAGQAQDALQRAMGDFYEKGVGEDELAAAKILVKADFLRANETKGSRAHSLCLFESMGLGYEFLSLYSSELDSVSLDDVIAYIRAYLSPERAHLVVVGPKIEEK
jgi:zinc protease